MASVPISGEIQLQRSALEFAPAAYDGRYSLRESPNPLSDSVHLDWEVQVEWGGSFYDVAGTLMGKNMTLHELAESAHDAIEYGVQHAQRNQLWKFKE